MESKHKHPRDYLRTTYTSFQQHGTAKECTIDACHALRPNNLVHMLHKPCGLQRNS